MNLSEGLVQRHETVFVHQVLRNLVINMSYSGKSAFDIPAERLLCQAAAKCIDRKNALVQKHVSCDYQVILPHRLEFEL